MADYIIENTTNFGVGLHKFNGLGINIAGGKRVALTEDDIVNEAKALTVWLKDGVLKCNNQKIYEMLGISNEEAVVAMSDAEIQQKFKLGMKQFTAWLDEQDSPYVLDKIAEVAAKTDDLAQKKLEMIQKKTGVHVAEIRKLNDTKEE